MPSKRRFFLVNLIISIVGIVWFLSAASFSAAMPPAGLRFLLGTGPSPGPGAQVYKISLFVHPKSDITNGTSYKNLPPGWTVSDLPNYGINLFPNNTVAPGTPLAVTTFVWLVPGGHLDNVGGSPQSVDLWTKYLMGGGSFPIAVDVSDIPLSLVISANSYQTIHWSLNPSPPPPGASLFASNAVGDSTDKPDIISSWAISDGIPATNCTSATGTTIYAEADLFYNADYSNPLNKAITSIICKPGGGSTSNTVDLNTGNVFLGKGVSGSGNLKLNFTSPSGQSIISQTGTYSNITDTGHLTKIGPHALAASSTASLETAKTALQRSLNKATQEIAQVCNTTSGCNDPVGTVSTFLTAVPSTTDKVLYPEGKMLVVMGSGNLTLPGPYQVAGKKLVVFTGYSNVNWSNDVTYQTIGSRNNNNKFASIVLAGNQNLSGTNYDGAYVALNLSSAIAQSITLGGTGSTMKITGLLVSDNIIVNRSVTSGTQLVSINYDSTFQNGVLLGLSPFISPLVSQGSSR